jgi:hypothetical protein
MLRNKLDLVAAQISEAIRNISLLGSITKLKLVRLVVGYHDERTCTIKAVPFVGSFFDIVYKIGVLKDRI